MIKDYFNGKFGLAATYWFGIAGVGILARLAVRAMNQAYLRAETDADIARLDLWREILVVVMAVYSILMVRAVYLSATQGRPIGGWGVLATIIAIAGAAFNSYSAYLTLQPSAAIPRSLVEIELQQLRRDLPAEFDDGSVLMDVRLVGNDMVYKYVVLEEIAEAQRSVLEDSMGLDTPDGQLNCRDMEGYIRGGIESIVFEFKFNNTTIEARMDGEECLAYLAAR